MKENELYLELEDNEWPNDYIYHKRQIARAIVYDDEYNFYFIKGKRNDIFGNCTWIETSGGGVEDGEDLEYSVKRELKEELGVEVDIVHKIGVVSDFYNLLNRNYINHYYLCKINSFGDKNLTEYEENEYHFETFKTTLEVAIKEYKKYSNSKLGRLIAQRELPILEEARRLLNL